MKNKITIPIAGMHCRSCELIIEDSLSKIAGVETISVNCKKGMAEIGYGDREPDQVAIEKAVSQCGYTLGKKEEKLWLSKNPDDFKDLGIAAIFLVGLYLIAKNLGFTGITIGQNSEASSLGIVFLVGITAGFSTCMALVGGFILGISARHAEIHPQASALQKFRPHLFFNLGRIGGYALLGGFLGILGNAIQLSGSVLGIMTIGVGMVMLALGLKLIGIFPRLENFAFTLPKNISKVFGAKSSSEKEYSHPGSMITGALTFFLPCGFTQAMQLLAVSSGSFSRGALIMGVFALGTAPGLLGVGGLTSLVKGVFAQRFFKFAGVLVILLALFNINNGFTLAKISLREQIASCSTTNMCTTPPATNTNVTGSSGNPQDAQKIYLTENASGYSPTTLKVKKGIPVELIVDAQDQYSCASTIIIPKFNIRKTLKAGQNVIELPASEAGTIPFSCSMGMYTGSIVVE